MSNDWWTILERMSNTERLCAIDLLLEYEDINVNAQDYNGCTALIFASFEGHFDIVNRLLECKEIDVKEQDKCGWNALMWASFNNEHIDIVNRLLECKEINVNIQDNDGFTALMWASKNEHLDVVNRLKKFRKNQITEEFDKIKPYFPCDLVIGQTI